MSCLPAARGRRSRLTRFLLFSVATLCASCATSFVQAAAADTPAPQPAPAPVRFAHPLILVRDTSASKRFYRDVVGLKVERDTGGFVLFEGDFAIHQESLIQGILGASAPIGLTPLGRNNLEVYFESPDVDAAYERIKDRAKIIHPVLEQSWGQRVFRFFDPDGHIVEVGEPSFLSFPDQETSRSF